MNDPSTATHQASPSHEPQAERPSLGSLVGRLAKALESSVGAGDLAALRRHRPADLPPPAFYRLATQHLEPAGSLPLGGPSRPAKEAQWCAILSAMARLVGLHAPRTSLGAALAEHGYHELRFERLLRADIESVAEHVGAASLYLATRAARFNQADIARLILTTDLEAAVDLRRRLARDYHRITSQTTRTS